MYRSLFQRKRPQEIGALKLTLLRDLGNLDPKNFEEISIVFYCSMRLNSLKISMKIWFIGSVTRNAMKIHVCKYSVLKVSQQKQNCSEKSCPKNCMSKMFWSGNFWSEKMWVDLFWVPEIPIRNFFGWFFFFKNLKSLKEISKFSKIFQIFFSKVFFDMKK